MKRPWSGVGQSSAGFRRAWLASLLASLLAVTVTAPVSAAGTLQGTGTTGYYMFTLESGPEDPVGCDPAGESTVPFESIVQVTSGPFVGGTVRYSGSFKVGPQTNPMAADGLFGFEANYGQVSELVGAFEVTQGGTVVATGSFTGLAPPLGEFGEFASNLGSCYGTGTSPAFGIDPVEHAALIALDAHVAYEATVGGDQVTGRLFMRQHQINYEVPDVGGQNYYIGGALNFYSPSTPVDSTDPVITYVGRSPSGSGWKNTDVEVEWSCADASSGVVAATVKQTVSSEGASQSATGTCTDNAGNTATDIQSDIDIDKTNPVITWNGGPVDGGSYSFGSVPGVPTCSAGDALSGPNGCTVSGYLGTVGSHTMTATAYDLAGNVTAQTRTFTVQEQTLAESLKGFYQPVDMSGVFNSVKGGSTVPLKFEVFVGSTELTDVATVQSFTQKVIACNAGAPEDAIEEIANTAGTVLRYDSVGGQFIQNWKTPRTANVCYQVKMTTQDGSSLYANFRLK